MSKSCDTFPGVTPFPDDAFARLVERGLGAIAPLPGLARRILVYPKVASMKTEAGVEVLGLDAFARLVERGLG
jgi:hypothetical protein